MKEGNSFSDDSDSDRTKLRRDIIGFKSKGTWNANELYNFVGSVSEIYDVFLAIYLAKNFDKQKIRENNKKITAIEIYLNAEKYYKNWQKLKIHRIIMSSPGGLSFAGIGEVIKEIRELIKDVWYRNRQEKIIGQIEVGERLFELQEKLGLDEDNKELVNILVQNFNNIYNFQSNGKIQYVPQFINYVVPKETPPNPANQPRNVRQPGSFKNRRSSNSGRWSSQSDGFKRRSF